MKLSSIRGNKTYLTDTITQGFFAITLEEGCSSRRAHGWVYVHTGAAASCPCLATSLVSPGKYSCFTEGLFLYEQFGETSLVIGLSR